MPLVTVRSSDPITVILEPDAALLLLVDVTADFPTYRLSIRPERRNAQPIWVLSDLEPTYLESLAISLPPGFLTGGRYRVTVEGERQDTSGTDTYEHIQDIVFDVQIGK